MLSPIKSTQQEETMALAAQNPLSGFIELNNQVFLYEPREPPLPPPAAGDRGPGRCLVIICAWLFAAPRHIAKYTRLYQARLPRADILLIRPVAGDMVWTADAAQIRRLEPAVVWRYAGFWRTLLLRLVLALGRGRRIRRRTER